MVEFTFLFNVMKLFTIKYFTKQLPSVIFLIYKKGVVACVYPHVPAIVSTFL